MLDTMERIISELFNTLNNPYRMWRSGNGENLVQLLCFLIKQFFIDYFEHINYKDIIFERLFRECRYCRPEDELSSFLKNKLEEMSKNQRKVLVSRMEGGYSVLFLACFSGNLNIVKYLIEVCNADPEQKGFCEIDDDHKVHYVSPLWAAAISNKLDVVKYLVLEVKVDINSCSDTGSTVVRSSCFMSRYEIVEFLIKNGADILKPNYEGGNCLINAVQSFDLCKLLIDNGADVNAVDIQNKTALHYAIQEYCNDTAVLLLKNGTDPFIQSQSNEDALCVACLKLNIDLFFYLIKNVSYTDERIANAFELLGSTFLDQEKDFESALCYWKRALMIRNCGDVLIEKKNLVEPKKTYLYLTEFKTLEELESISNNIDLIRIQSLLISERILGKQNKTMIFRLMYRGAFYADNFEYQRCIDLWNYALKLRIEKDTILHSEAFIGFQSLVKLYLNLYKKYSLHVVIDKLKFEDVYKILDLVIEQFKFVTEFLKVKPIFLMQIRQFDKLLKLVLHLVYILNEISETNNQKQNLNLIIKKIIKLNLRNSSGDSVLHLAVSGSSSIKYSKLEDEDDADYNSLLFPNFKVTKLFLNNGANPDITNDYKSSPLHLACTITNYNSNIVSILLENGAHLDRTNINGNQPIKQLQSIKSYEIKPLKFISLQCLAARKLVETKQLNKNRIPNFLKDFVDIHRVW